MSFYPSKTDYLVAEWFKPFILEAFDYFNGKVNVINSKATLVLFETYDERGILGTIDWPSILKLNNVNIVISSRRKIYELDKNMLTEDKQSFTNDFVDMYKSKLINIIVHELFHLDQINNSYELSTAYSPEAINNPYNTKIEEDVYAMTALYMRSNSEIIKNKFNINNLYIELGNSIYNEDAIPHYNRLRPYDYYIQLFREICNENILFDINTLTTILYSHKNIILHVFGCKIWIKSNGEFILSSIPFVSSVLYNACISKSYIYRLEIFTECEFNSTIIELEINDMLIKPASFNYYID